MVRTNAERGEQQQLPAWVLASAVWLDRNKNGINVFECLWIVCFQNPALLADTVFAENSDAPGLLLVRPFASRLKRSRVLNAGLCVQIEGIEDQSSPFGVKDSAVRLVRPFPGNVVHREG
jgi:hypothetical protein